VPPLKRSILPALNDLHFHGATEYLEELVALIDAPQLDDMHIIFFTQIDFDQDFDCPRLAQFINLTPKLRALNAARVRFFDYFASVKLGYRTSQSDPKRLEIEISSREPDWQFSSIEQLCNSTLPPLSTVEDLYIEYWQLLWKNESE
jgi:hypothetical protein